MRRVMIVGNIDTYSLLDISVRETSREVRGTLRRGRNGDLHRIHLQ